MWLHVHTHTHIYIYIYIHIHTYIHTYIHIYIYICIYTHVCLCIMWCDELWIFVGALTFSSRLGTAEATWEFVDVSPGRMPTQVAAAKSHSRVIAATAVEISLFTLWTQRARVWSRCYVCLTNPLLLLEQYLLSCYLLCQHIFWSFKFPVEAMLCCSKTSDAPKDTVSGADAYRSNVKHTTVTSWLFNIAMENPL